MTYKNFILLFIFDLDKYKFVLKVSPYWFISLLNRKSDIIMEEVAIASFQSDNDKLNDEFSKHFYKS